jgi:hypothetical protein
MIVVSYFEEEFMENIRIKFQNYSENGRKWDSEMRHSLKIKADIAI